MLQSIRDRAQGIVAWAIVGLIIITFALLGLGSYLSGSSTLVIATVDGVDISETEFTREYQRNQEYFQKMLGENYNANLFDEQIMRQRVIDGLVQRELVTQLLEDEHYNVAPTQVISYIQQVPAFKDETGNFSTERLQQVLATQRMTSEMLKQRVAHDLANEYMQTGIQASGFVTDQYLESISKLNKQERKAGYFILPLKIYLSKSKLSEDEITAFYKENSSRFQIPEKVSVEYIELKLDELTRNFTVTDDEAKAYYESNKDNFVTSSEARKVRHILIEVNDSVDEKTAKASAQGIYQQLVEGIDFAELAKTASKDILSARKGGDLGLLRIGDDLDTVFENSVFKMQAGEISKPVRSRFGYHVIKLEKIVPQNIKSFAETKEGIKKNLAAENADKHFASQSDKLYTLSFENPDSLEVAANELGLKIQKTELFSRAGGTGLFANKKLVSAALSEDVLNQNRNSDMLEISDVHKVVIHLAEHIPAGMRPLTEVKTIIESILYRQKAGALAQEKASSIKADLDAGVSIAKISKKYNLIWNKEAYIGRTSKSAGSELAPAIRSAVFKARLNQDGSPVYQMVRLSGGGAAVIAVYDVKANNEKIGISETERQTAQQQFGTLEFGAYMDYLKNKATIEINLKTPDE